MHISNEHKEVLEEYGINNCTSYIFSHKDGHSQCLVLDVHYVKWGKSGPARDVARHVYDKIDSDLTYLAERMMIAKEDASKRRNPLARPHISDTEVREFLKELEDGTPGLTSLLEIARFAHIKLTANIDAPGHGNRIPWGTPE